MKIIETVKSTAHMIDKDKKGPIGDIPYYYLHCMRCEKCNSLSFSHVSIPTLLRSAVEFDILLIQFISVIMGNVTRVEIYPSIAYPQLKTVSVLQEKEKKLQTLKDIH